MYMYILNVEVVDDCCLIGEIQLVNNAKCVFDLRGIFSIGHCIYHCKLSFLCSFICIYWNVQFGCKQMFYLYFLPVYESNFQICLCLCVIVNEYDLAHFSIHYILIMALKPKNVTLKYC